MKTVFLSSVVILLILGVPWPPATWPSATWAQDESLAAVTGSDPELEEQIEQVRCREIAFSRSCESGEWDDFRSFIHPEARFPSMNGVGPDQITAGWRQGFSSADRSIRWRPRSVEILKPGELALSRGPYRVTAVTEEGSTESWGTFNSVWSFDEGEWRIIFDLGSEGIEEGDRELLLSESSGCPD